MWPLYILVAKLLKMDDGNDQLLDTDCSHDLQKHSFGFLYSPNKGYNTLLVRSYFVDVPHIRQLCNWDCGLACALMVLRTLGIENCDIHTLGKICNTTSIWTIDLAYLLHRFSVNFSFLTVTIGANPDFSVESFYKEQLPGDVERVDRLFRKARENGIDIECRCITGQEISVLILSGQYIAIALVDKCKLSHKSLGNFSPPEWLDSSPSYTGHFVVICGYDRDTNEFEIRDPASSSKHERISFNCLDEARKSYGTDEDILLVSRNKKENLDELLL